MPAGERLASVLTWRELRGLAVDRLIVVGVDDPRTEVRWMVEQASGRDAAEQAADADAAVTDREHQAMERMLARREQGEPLQYVLGRWGFRTLDLLVDQRVLIPRPETEVVAGIGVDVLAGLDRTGRAVDLGTGSGAIALSLAAERWPQVEVWATDRSPGALAVARANLAGLGRRATVVQLLEGDWYEPLPDSLRRGLDLVISNPPYVAAGEELPAEVADWEPSDALVAGSSGLEAIAEVVRGAPRWLRPGGVLVVEIGETQGDAAMRLALDAGLGAVEVRRDLAGRDRALVARAAGDAGG